MSKLDDDIIKNENDILIFNPYNPLNVEISLNDVQSILKRYGVPCKINNIELFKRAFIHRSYTKRPEFENEKENIVILEKPHDCLPLKTKSNERLEFLGDGVLECVSKYYLYKRFPKENEGFMTEKKIALVKNEAIGKLAYEMRLHKFYIISKHAEEKGTRINLKKLGCLFEAFLGALFLDSNNTNVYDDDGYFQNVFTSTGPGFQYAQTFLENIFEKHVDWVELIQNDYNFKNILQVKIQKEFKITPHYIELENDQDYGYKMAVYICLGQSVHNASSSDAINFEQFNSFKKIHEYLEKNGKILVFLGEGQHKIKKKAEQIACEKSLNKIEQCS